MSVPSPLHGNGSDVRTPGTSPLLSLGTDLRAPVEGSLEPLERVYWEWLLLCRWDPGLAPGVRPPFASEMVEATAAALEREQPLGWGLDTALESIVDDFAAAAGEVHIALGELVCLREAFTRVIIEELPIHERTEAARRLQMIAERTMLSVAQAGARRLEQLALTDGLTGLGNRAAFDQDFERECARIARHSSPLAVAVIDLDGLKLVNDRDGHGAGDEVLRRLARAIRGCARLEDRGYRIGGDEFVLLMTDSTGIEADELAARLRAAGAPPLSIGVATHPPEAPDALIALADARLYERRALERGSETDPGV